MTVFKRQSVAREKTPSVAIAKWGYPVLSEGFVPFPKKFLRSFPGILGSNAAEKLQVILAIVDYIRDDLKNPASKAFLAHLAGLPVETFKSVLSELEASKLIEVKGTDDAIEVKVDGLVNAVLRVTEKEAT